MVRRWLLFGIWLYGLTLILLGLFAGTFWLGVAGEFSPMESATIGSMFGVGILSMAALLYGFHSTNRDIRLSQR